MFNLDDDLFCCLVYNVPSGSSRNALIDRNIFDNLCEDILYFENLTKNKCNFLLTGDWNARVGQRYDFVENESLFNLDILPSDYIEDTYLPRKSQDVNVNDYGLRFLEFLKLTDFKIMNGKKL